MATARGVARRKARSGSNVCIRIVGIGLSLRFRRSARVVLVKESVKVKKEWRRAELKRVEMCREARGISGLGGVSFGLVSPSLQ